MFDNDRRIEHYNIQGVSKIRVLILTSGRTRQFMKLFFLEHWLKFASFSRFFAP
jgi:hypothetical protein